MWLFTGFLVDYWIVFIAIILYMIIRLFGILKHTFWTIANTMHYCMLSAYTNHLPCSIMLLHATTTYFVYVWLGNSDFLNVQAIISYCSQQMIEIHLLHTYFLQKETCKEGLIQFWMRAYTTLFLPSIIIISVCMNSYLHILYANYCLIVNFQTIGNVPHQCCCLSSVTRPNAR